MAQDSILIVDDNPVNMKLIPVLLAEEGQDVCTASDADEALTVLSELHPGPILMNIRLPGIDGCDLTRLLKSAPATRATPIVRLTPYSMKGEEKRIIVDGCDG